jgi:serine/threonine-protein kinase
MSAEATLPLAPGDLVAGKYQVDRVLGVGGMGAVFSAVDHETGERVAIKCLLPTYCENVDVITRFLREGRATMRLTSEHIARVSATGALDSGVPYIVMEHLDGRDLRSVVKHSGPLPVHEAAAYVSQVCAALAEAHALGIVHRDLKPANLFLTRRPNGTALIKVLDFGIAKYTSPSLLGDQVEMTRTQTILGSRAYMSPEQMLRPKEVDARADIWSLGVILYFFVTGKNPFASDTTEAMIMRIIQGTPEPLTALVPGLPPAFEAVVLRCLAKAREARFSNVTELARALAPFGRDLVDHPTMSLDDSPPPRSIKPPEPSGPTIRGYSVPEASQPVVVPSARPQPVASRTSLSHATRRALPLMLAAGATLIGSGIVVGSFIVNTRRPPGRVATQPSARAASSVIAPPIALAIVEEDPVPALLVSASIGAPASAAPPTATAPHGGKSPSTKASVPRAGSKPKPPNQPTDSPW